MRRSGKGTGQKIRALVREWFTNGSERTDRHEEAKDLQHALMGLQRSTSTRPLTQIQTFTESGALLNLLLSMSWYRSAEITCFRKRISKSGKTIALRRAIVFLLLLKSVIKPVKKEQISIYTDSLDSFGDLKRPQFLRNWHFPAILYSSVLLLVSSC